MHLKSTPQACIFTDAFEHASLLGNHSFFIILFIYFKRGIKENTRQIIKPLIFELSLFYLYTHTQISTITDYKWKI